MNYLTRRDLCKLLALSPLAPGTARSVTDRPDIVYILTDDLGWGDLGCYNAESKIPTPNADRLAHEGMRFTDMHSPSAVCTPTRYGIMTGRYCWRTHLKSGVLWGYSPNLIEPGRMTVASMLKSQGYYTAGVGKWHLGLGEKEKADYSAPLHPCPNDHGFDYYFGIPASLDMDPYLYFENDRVLEQPTAHTEGKTEPRGVFWRPGPIAPGLKIEEVLPTLTAKAEEIIRLRGRKPEQPFFLYLALTGPHTPWVPAKEFRNKSGAGIYGDFVAQTDAALGRVLQALKETKRSNTLVIFTSDNGAHWTPEDKKKYPHRSNAHWRGMKADIWDGGHRVPFLARWPGKVRAGSVNKDLGCLTDLLATAAEIAGAKLPENSGEDSFTSLPAMLGKKPARDTVIHHSMEGVFSVRQGEWKLALGLGSGGFSEPKKLEATADQARGQLYNIAADPSEMDNVYAKHPDIVARLTALLENYKEKGRSRGVS